MSAAEKGLHVHPDRPPRPTLRRRVHGVLVGEDQGGVARAVRGGIMLLIVLNVTVVVMESIPSVAARHGGFFSAFETFSVIVFTAEYLLRLWSIVEQPRFAHPVLGRFRYASTFMALVDLVAILPFFLPAVLKVDTRFVRALRLVRLLRVLKLGRNNESFEIYARIFRDKAGDLIAALAMLIMLLLLASSLMYFVEHEAQPKIFATIPDAMWWGIVTMTTIGYGDAYPVTALGKVLGGVVALFGVAFFALPPSILVSGIMEEMQRTKAREELLRPPAPQLLPERAPVHVCPNCGVSLHGE
jgi:voltage-gated potassium channel